MMKKLLLVLAVCLMPMLAGADKYLYVVGSTTMIQEDVQLIRAKLSQRLNDARQVVFSSLPLWRLAADPSKEARVLCIDVKCARNKGFNLTLAEIEAWRDAQISQPARLLFFVGNSLQVLRDAGLEEVPLP